MPGAPAKTHLRSILPNNEEFLKALEEAGMPRDDLATSRGAYFALVDAAGHSLGYCGYEKLDGALALIRSCVAPRAHRGKGAGRAMMDAVLELLAGEGMRELYLFTMDADPFFAKLGFEVVARDAAPDAIRATSQFTMECCDDAILMRRGL